jgi:tetratricopeptide (TPR) repeat protein
MQAARDHGGLLHRAIEMEIIMRPSAFLLSLLLTGAAFGVPSALAVDNVTSKDAPDLTSVRAKIRAKDFKAALAELTPMLATYQHADVYNLMGFSLRKTGDYKQAYTFYRKALDFNPEHKGALEYLGELYVETGELDKAKQNVVLLKKLCPEGCEELADLEKAVVGAATNASAKVN